MPEPASRPPIADAALSLVLVASDFAPALRNIVSDWRKVLSQRQQPFEILLVTGGTVEDAAAGSDELITVIPELKVVPQDKPGGFGTALRVGIAAAQHPLICYCAADGRYEPADLRKMLAAIDKVDLVAGCRLTRRPPRWLRVVGLVWRLLARVALGIPLEPHPCWPGWSGAPRRWFVRWVFGVYVDDPDCAFRLARRELLASIPIQSRGSFVHSEIVAKANFRGAYLTQVPVSCRPAADHATADTEPPTWRDIRRVMSHPDFGPADSLHLLAPMH